MMNKHIIVAGFLLFEIYCIKADVQELKVNDRSYLSPLENNLNKGYLPPDKKILQLSRSSHESNDFTKGNFNYKHNKPIVIDDPLPTKVDYVQPLALDFASGKYKPIYKGTLISGLFYNENEANSLNRDTSKETPLNEEVKTHKKEQLQTEATTSNSLKYKDKSREINKNSKGSLEDVIPINYYADEVTMYKLFNYDDDTTLSNSEPVVIFKPGDDISFTEDTTIIDDYEHMFPVEFIKKHLKPSTLKTTSTTTPSPSPPTDDPHSNEATKHQTTSAADSESNHTTRPGYIYDKPKITFTF
ncbi:uncharacterized protein LOC111683010 [Lucilia cuprina]|uniref:uncharacterized protein LOC111683010 n=1 Tax=Lucilia cuprina TaxID=7375 RepID=UPI001F06F959|nr:uncharacterized protein LOC111683010 [Lucilia cuprina]